MKKILLIASLLLLVGTPAYAVTGPFAGNGSFYEAFAGNFDWAEAKTLAESSSYLGRPGYLATFTSAAESTFAWTGLGSGLKGYYLGGFQDPGTAEPNTAWQWVTGEPWSYTNWAGGEPNDYNNFDMGFGEDALAFWDGGKWNDLPHIKDVPGDGRYEYINGYVVEYAVPEPISSVLYLIGGISLSIAGFRKRKKRA